MWRRIIGRSPSNDSSLAPGDVVYLPGSHVGICYAILARDQYGRPTLIDMVDSNYVKSWVISRHSLSVSGWYIWTNNTPYTCIN